MTPQAYRINTSVGTIFDLAGKAVEGAETLAALNMQTLKTMMAESLESSRIAGSSRNPAELIKLQSDALQAAPLKASAYGRQVREVFATFGAAQQAAYQDSIASAQARFLEKVGTFFSNAPGSEKMVAMAQSAVDVSNNAYKRMSTASTQMSDALTANATKVGNTVAAIEV